MQFVLHLHRFDGHEDLALFDLVIGAHVDLAHDAGHRRLQHPLARRIDVERVRAATAAPPPRLRADRHVVAADEHVKVGRRFLRKDVVRLPVDDQRVARGFVDLHETHGRGAIADRDAEVTVAIRLDLYLLRVFSEP